MAGSRNKAEGYFDQAYWNNRYTRDPGPFDWYQRYGVLAPLIKMYIKTTDHILMVGCGSARLSEDMVKDGYSKIMNIDISDVLIQIMISKYKHMPELQYKTMDVRSMKEFKDEEFFCVLDKGMLDNLMCGSSAQACAASMLSEVHRVLKPGGIYMLVSYGDPRGRIAYLRTKYLPWASIKLHAIPRPGSRRGHEVYPLKKLAEPIKMQRDLSMGPWCDVEDPDLHYVYICSKQNPKAKAEEKSLEVPKSSKLANLKKSMLEAQNKILYNKYNSE